MFLQIGQFSKMTRLSTKALRLYDEIGLLRPAHVDSDSGYRYYDRAQANRAEAIRILRSVDMPLEEISAILDASDPDTAQQRLLEHRARLVEQLAAQERMLSYLEAIIQRKEITMSYEISTARVEPVNIASVKLHTKMSEISANIGQGLGLVAGRLTAAGTAPVGMPFVIYHELIDQETSGDMEMCMPVAAPFAGDDEVTGRELEGATVARTLHTGPYEELGQAYQAILAWITEHGHQVVGPPREHYLNDPTTVAPAEIQTRIDFPIRPADS